ncbi:MAG: TraB/GumN family protein [Bacteroidota bacterium]
MSRTITLFFSLITLLLYSCQSNKSITADGTDVTSPQDDLSNALLWEISGNDLTTNSFLFGTIHMINSEDYFLPEGTLSAIDKSERMVFEIDMAELSDPMKLMPIMQKAYMKGDTSLQDLLSDEEYKSVEAHFSDMGLPVFFLERIKPMFLSVFASGDFDPDDLNTGAVKSYEMEFAAMATSSGKSTGGLETVDFQIGLFDEIPYRVQAQMLLEAINAADTEDDTFKALIQSYKDQDITALYRMMQEDESVADFEDILLVKRNKNWIPQMKTMMTEQTTFFAVGAGHLGGPYGVINLLKEEGYKVSPIIAI